MRAQHGNPAWWALLSLVVVSCQGGADAGPSESVGWLESRVDDCDAADKDGDGWSVCDDDCDDLDAEVNPGAFEIVGNGTDDDCDAATLDAKEPAPCGPNGTKLKG